MLFEICDDHYFTVFYVFCPMLFFLLLAPMLETLTVSICDPYIQ